MQVSDASASGCKSVARATKVRILHLPHVLRRAADLRKRGFGAVLPLSHAVPL